MPGTIQKEEFRVLFRWQRRMRKAFVALWVYLLLVIAVHLLVRPASWVIQVALLPVLGGVVAGGVLQFSVRCPKCGYRLGFQSSLVIPDDCRRCGVLLKAPRDTN